MLEWTLIGLCALAVILVVALACACKSLVTAKTQLGLEIARRNDQQALYEARQRALDA